MTAATHCLRPHGPSTPTVHQKGKVNAQNFNCDGARLL
jgi:hypothetical protein